MSFKLTVIVEVPAGVELELVIVRVTEIIVVLPEGNEIGLAVAHRSRRILGFLLIIIRVSVIIRLSNQLQGFKR